MIARSVVAALFAASVAGAQPVEAPLPPTIPWTGKSERLMARADDPWITPSERTGLTATPNYAETRAWLDRLDAASSVIRIEPFGNTAQGRELYAVIASKDGDALDPKKPLLLVQAGIHSGEIDGKDAGMMLLRDIALRGKDLLLDRANLIFVPIFNADGHERASRFNRPNQRGPVEQGWRTTAQNLNLNRDYLKVDSPEMRAMIALIRKYDPALYLDLHVTDGTDYQYDITYAFSGWRGLYAKSPAVGRWLDSRFRPAIDKALKASGHIPGYYVSAVDNRAPEKGMTQDADTPRFSTGYGDHRRLPTVLLETHSLKPYRQCVLGTYVFVEAALGMLGRDGAAARAAIAEDRAARPAETVLRWKRREAPLYQIDFLGVAYDRYRSPASGQEEVRWLGRPITQRMPVYGDAPELSVAMPAAWWVPATAPEVIERLRVHGIAFETIDSPRSVSVDMVRLIDPKLGDASEGRVPLTTAGFAPVRRTESFPAGSVRVPADQPLGLLAAALLEAESPDSVLAWNFFPGMLQRTEYIEGYAIAPLAEKMLAADPTLRQAFEAKLAADPAFAADGYARLEWFYQRTPYYDDRYLLYPIARERAAP